MTPQHLDALAKANAIRVTRAAMKRAVKSGEQRVSEVLKEHPVPDWLVSMSVEELLSVTPRFPSELGRQMIREIPAKLTASVGDLTYRKRCLLATSLSQWEASRPQAGVRKNGTRHAFGAGRNAGATKQGIHAARRIA